MGLVWEQMIVDAIDPSALGSWWARALGWVVVDDGAESGAVEIRPTPDTVPGLLFSRHEQPKTAKNRWHPDFRPVDQEAEVRRLLDLGARRADVGQTGDEGWVVLLDPEGNEFCVLAAH
jgi:predicted enzyme related to lactoylglutathione lyase